MLQSHAEHLANELVFRYSWGVIPFDPVHGGFAMHYVQLLSSWFR